MAICNQCGTFTDDRKKDEESGEFFCRRCGANLNANSMENTKSARKKGGKKEGKKEPKGKNEPKGKKKGVEPEILPASRPNRSAKMSNEMEESEFTDVPVRRKTRGGDNNGSPSKNQKDDGIKGVICPTCRTKVEEGMTVCLNCGYWFTPYEKPKKVKPEKEKKEKSGQKSKVKKDKSSSGVSGKTIALGLGAVLVLGGAVLGFTFMNQPTGPVVYDNEIPVLQPVVSVEEKKTTIFPEGLSYGMSLGQVVEVYPNLGALSAGMFGLVLSEELFDTLGYSVVLLHFNGDQVLDGLAFGLDGLSGTEIVVGVLEEKFSTENSENVAEGSDEATEGGENLSEDSVEVPEGGQQVPEGGEQVPEGGEEVSEGGEEVAEGLESSVTSSLSWNSGEGQILYLPDVSFLLVCESGAVSSELESLFSGLSTDIPELAAAEMELITSAVASYALLADILPEVSSELTLVGENLATMAGREYLGTALTLISLIVEESINGYGYFTPMMFENMAYFRLVMSWFQVSALLAMIPETYNVNDKTDEEITGEFVEEIRGTYLSVSQGYSTVLEYLDALTLSE